MNQPPAWTFTSARTVRELVRQLGDEGGTCHLLNHQLAEAQRVCNRIVIIHNGEVRADGPDELLEQTQTHHLEEAYISLTGDVARPRQEDDKPISKVVVVVARIVYTNNTGR